MKLYCDNQAALVSNLVFHEKQTHRDQLLFSSKPQTHIYRSYYPTNLISNLSFLMTGLQTS